MNKTHAHYLPPLYQDSPEHGRLILRDGSTASIRSIQPDDQKATKEFFERLTPESRWLRFFSMAKPDPKLIQAMCNPTDPAAQTTLIVTRVIGGESRIIAVATYWGQKDKTAEVALAVDDLFQGKGIGTLLLERLALLAVRNGFLQFTATTHASNQPMLEVFRRSGFPVHEKREDGYVELNFSVEPTESSVERSETVDRVFTTASLIPVFQPKSIAIVGASRDPSSIGYRILEELVSNRFQGPVYPVNPKARVIGSIHAYPNVKSLPEPVDLAIITVPVPAVMSVVDDCAANGVRALVVITAGFAELGGSGGDAQKKLLEKIRGYGMRMVGPNCMGVLNTDPNIQMNASFSPIFPPSGRVAMSSQSGALGIAILDFARQREIGLSTFVSVGNKADVSGNDLLQYWEEDPNTDVILLYLESFGNPRRFARLARRVSRSKPIVAVKSGRTLAGKRAAGSHTAAMAASDIAVEALFNQTGVIRAQSLEEMFDLAAMLGNQPLPKGKRVGVITNAGGPGILCTDTCEANGLIVPELSKRIQSNLKKFLPAAAGLSNPVDMIASAPPEHYRKTIECVLNSDEIDALIVIYIPVMNVHLQPVREAISEAIATAREKNGSNKPVLACLMSDKEGSGTLSLTAEKIPAYRFPEVPAMVLGKAAEYAEWRRTPPGIIPDFEDIDIKTAREICVNALKTSGSGWLSAQECRDVLKAMRLPLPDGDVAKSAEEAAAIAEKVQFPVAVKLASRELVHKTEIGGVRLNLRTAEEVKNAFEEIRKGLKRSGQESAMEGVIVQPMISNGIELMVGATEDPSFGPLIAFGLGGIHVEILQDVCFRVNPLTDQDASQMVRQIRGFKLLQGYRGHPAADIQAIENLLLRVSRLVEDVPEITELDLNPIFALPPGQGCIIADMRIKVE
jgi:acetyl coenzyme A synthetase (ADP forming)-like protein